MVSGSGSLLVGRIDGCEVFIKIDPAALNVAAADIQRLTNIPDTFQERGMRNFVDGFLRDANVSSANTVHMKNFSPQNRENSIFTGHGVFTCSKLQVGESKRLEKKVGEIFRLSDERWK
ncbi:hypothetical protein K0M31_014506 [Melipona bicolor]|uniref:Uncharacterized protein n=1 Tax=Melipona bicolor TaxID=60889 RepID=A0AA40G8R4_9HYME|nr:hypothetical protein K0M31_014506 [Melipona bicolor]